MTRLARYRELLARLEPTGPKEMGSDPEIYVPRTSDLAIKLANTLALKPTGSHLLVGAIGSGKTTTALQTVKALKAQVAETGDWVEYIDVSREHRLDEEPLAGVLLALAGIALTDQVLEGSKAPTLEVGLALWGMRRHARDYREWVPDKVKRRDDEWPFDVAEPTGGSFVHRAGVLRPPSDKHLRFDEIAAHLRVLREMALGGRNAVLVFDSLDRLLDGDRFRSAVEHDLPALKAAGIGVVVVGPYRFGLSTDRMAADWFDQILVVQNGHTLGAAFFLDRVLRKRATPNMISDECVGRIVNSCGGIIRDLLSIAQRAATEAYEAGHDAVEMTDVDAAVLALGSAKAVGLDDRSLKTLIAVEAGVPFVLEENLPMAERGQVVQTGVGEWAVHPALSLFLQRVSKAA